jgi:hypothetical protein
MNGGGKDLLLDIALLVKRYPPEDWNRLVALLEDDSTRERVLSLLRRARNLSEAHYATPRKEIVRQLSKERNPSLPVANLNRNLDLLVAELPIARLKQLAKDFGVPTSSKDSRIKLVRRITNTLRTQSTSAKHAYLDLLRTRSSSGEYEKWVSIILGKQRS